MLPWVSSVLTVSILGLPWCLKFLSTRATSHLLTSLIGVLRCVKLWYYVLLSLFWQYLNQIYNSFLQDFIALQKTASIVSLFINILYLFFTLKQYSYQRLILTCNEFLSDSVASYMNPNMEPFPAFMKSRDLRSQDFY